MLDYKQPSILNFTEHRFRHNYSRYPMRFLHCNSPSTENRNTHPCLLTQMRPSIELCSCVAVAVTLTFSFYTHCKCQGSKGLELCKLYLSLRYCKWLKTLLNLIAIEANISERGFESFGLWISYLKFFRILCLNQHLSFKFYSFYYFKVKKFIRFMLYTDKY